MTTIEYSSAFTWYGGKRSLLHWLYPLEPADVQCVCDVFAGSAAYLLGKNRPGVVEILNDIDGDCTHFFQTLRDPHTRDALTERILFTEYGRNVFLEAKQLLEQHTQDPVLRAWAFFVVYNQSINSEGRSFATNKRPAGKKNAPRLLYYQRRFHHVLQLVERLQNIIIENLDFRTLIPKYDSPHTFFYLDPPYLPQTRTPGKRYRYEMTPQDHQDLVQLCLQLQGKAILSGYDHPLYQPLEHAGWRKLQRDVPCWTSLQIQKPRPRRTECVWTNCHPQQLQCVITSTPQD